MFQPTVKPRWQISSKVLTRMSDMLEIPSPAEIRTWVDDMKRWPAVSYPDIFNYLVLSEGYDGGEMQNYKSMDSFNYFKSGKVSSICSLLEK